MEWPASPGGPGFYLISPGPNGVFDVSPEHIPLIKDGVPIDLGHLVYDPSNGTVSGGDIMRSHFGSVQPIEKPQHPGSPSAEPSDLILAGPKP